MSKITLNWQHDGVVPDSFSVYRATATMDPNNLPAALVSGLAGSLLTYDDTTVIPDATYYYRVSAIKGTTEKVSDELMQIASL